MQTRPRLAVLISLFTALMTALVLTSGCSSDKKNDAPLPDAAALLKQSTETTKGEKSVHLVLTVTGDIKNFPIHTMTGDLTNVPAVAASGGANITALGSQLDIKFVVLEGTLYATITPDVWTDLGPAADIYDVSTILSPDKGLANILSNFSDAKAEGREAINGVEAVKITGKVTADAVNAIAPRIEATGTVPATAWIREDGSHELLQATIEPTQGNTVQMTTTDWGKPVTVTKPDVS
jgi:lipoprotein LprG